MHSISMLATVLLFFLAQKTFSLELSDLLNPCPNTFKYQVVDEQLYGIIYARAGLDGMIDLQVNMSIGNSVYQSEDRLSVIGSNEEILTKINLNLPVQFLLKFPAWDRPPRITSIRINNQIVCFGPPYTYKDDGVTVITSLSASKQIKPISAPIRPFKERTPVYFKPEPPQERPYQKNPFFLESPSMNTLPATDPYANNPFFNDVPRQKPTTRITSTAKPQTQIYDDEDICGTTKAFITPLIFGGENVTNQEEFPWLAALYHKTQRGGMQYACSGTLISKKHVVTSAHCVINLQGVQLPASKILISLGNPYLDAQTSINSRIRAVAELFTHEAYSLNQLDADICVVRLADPLAYYTDQIRPICLWSGPSRLDDIVGKRGIVVGWGLDENGGIGEGLPKKIEMPVVSQAVCRRSSSHFEPYTTNRTFCAGERNDQGPCNGDSGTGFIMNRGGKWTLRGVVSFSLVREESGRKQCDLGNYIVFVDVTKFSDFLNRFL